MDGQWVVNIMTLLTRVFNIMCRIAMLPATQLAVIAKFQITVSLGGKSLKSWIDVLQTGDGILGYGISGPTPSVLGPAEKVLFWILSPERIIKRVGEEEILRMASDLVAGQLSRETMDCRREISCETIQVVQILDEQPQTRDRLQLTVTPVEITEYAKPPVTKKAAVYSA